MSCFYSAIWNYVLWSILVITFLLLFEIIYWVAAIDQQLLLWSILVTREKAWLLIYGEDAREGWGGDGSGLLDDQIEIAMTGRVEWLVCRGGTSCRDAQGVGTLPRNPPVQMPHPLVSFPRFLHVADEADRALHISHYSLFILVLMVNYIACPCWLISNHMRLKQTVWFQHLKLGSMVRPSANFVLSSSLAKAKDIIPPPPKMLLVYFLASSKLTCLGLLCL